MVFILIRQSFYLQKHDSGNNNDSSVSLVFVQDLIHLPLSQISNHSFARAKHLKYFDALLYAHSFNQLLHDYRPLSHQFQWDLVDRGWASSPDLKY